LVAGYGLRVAGCEVKQPAFGVRRTAFGAGIRQMSGVCGLRGADLSNSEMGLGRAQAIRMRNVEFKKVLTYRPNCPCAEGRIPKANPFLPPFNLKPYTLYPIPYGLYHFFTATRLPGPDTWNLYTMYLMPFPVRR